MTFYKVWEQIPWNKLEKHVAKLQKQIFRAQMRGERRKLRHLQKLLINSKANLLLSIRRVTQKNKGKKTAGIDKFIALTNKERIELYHKLTKVNLKEYNPPPVKRTKIKKKNGKLRPLGIPTITDRIFQNVLKNALEPQWEAIFEPFVYGFRPKRSAHDAIERIHNDLKNGKRKYIFEGDFKGCFDNLNHDFIIKRLKGFPEINLIKKWLKAGCLNEGTFEETTTGTPQGSIISPLLANIALSGMQEILGITYKKTTNKDKEGKTKVYYSTQGKYRIAFYADDFVIMCETKEDAKELYEILKPYLKKRGLTLQQEKTKITNIYDGFDFLGFNIRGHDSRQSRKKTFKLIIKPSKESVKEAKHKIKEVFRNCQGKNVEILITKLNPVIRGIANYWSTVSAKETFSNIDNYIWIKTKRFLSRLHPKKSWKWIIKQYFKPDYTGQSKDRWILTDPDNPRYQLLRMSWFPIRYHRIIAYKSSPFDSNLANYFQLRNIAEFNRCNIFTRRELAKRQHYKCPICDKSISDPCDSYDIHHQTPKCKGGKSTMNNIQLLHSTCHREYHKIFPGKYGRPTDNNIKAFKIVYKQKLWGKNRARAVCHESDTYDSKGRRGRQRP